MHHITYGLNAVFSAPHRVITVAIIISFMIVSLILMSQTQSINNLFSDVPNRKINSSDEFVKGSSSSQKVNTYNSVISCIHNGNCHPSYDLNHDGYVNTLDVYLIIQNQ